MLEKDNRRNIFSLALRLRVVAIAVMALSVGSALAQDPQLAAPQNLMGNVMTRLGIIPDAWPSAKTTNAVSSDTSARDLGARPLPRGRSRLALMESGGSRSNRLSSSKLRTRLRARSPASVNSRSKPRNNIGLGWKPTIFPSSVLRLRTCITRTF